MSYTSHHNPLDTNDPPIYRKVRQEHALAKLLSAPSRPHDVIPVLDTQGDWRCSTCRELIDLRDLSHFEVRVP